MEASVVECYAQSLVAAFEGDAHAPKLAAGKGEVMVEINGCMHSIQLDVHGASKSMSSFEAIQSAVMLLAGAHAVRVIARKEDPHIVA